MVRWLYVCVGVLAILALVTLVLLCRRYRVWRWVHRRPRGSAEVVRVSQKAAGVAKTDWQDVDLEAVPSTSANVYELAC